MSGKRAKKVKFLPIGQFDRSMLNQEGLESLDFAGKLDGKATDSDSVISRFESL